MTVPSWNWENGAPALWALLAGGVGGWVSTWWKNREDRNRQQVEHEHARRLAETKAEVDTAAAVRADRVTLYLELMDVTARLHEGMRMLNLSCLGRWAPGFDERTQRLKDAADDHAAARRDLWALLPRVNLIAGSKIRETFLALNDLTEELAVAASPLCGGGTWDDDVDGKERDALRA